MARKMTKVGKIIKTIFSTLFTALLIFQISLLNVMDIVPQVTAADLKVLRDSMGIALGRFTQLIDPQCYAQDATSDELIFGAANANLAQAFQTDLFTGNASYSYQIAVPPGRKGIQPNLNISYSPTAGNGFFGFGWQLSLGRIERSTKRGAPKYDSSDTFIFSLGGSNQELVEIAPGEYRAKIEQAFSRFAFDGTSWLVTDKKGTKYYLGQTSDSRQEKDVSNVYSWYLDKVIDVYGNSLSLTYQLDQNQIYPQTISYAANDLQADPAKYVVEFIVEDRPDQVINCRSGAKITSAKRIKTIEVKYNQDLVRKYVLNYEESFSASRSILRSISQYGSDGITSLPPIEFTYSEKRPQFDGYETWTNISKAGGTNDYYYVRYNGVKVRVEIFDINGDGFPDRVMQNAADGYWEVQLHNGSGGFDNVINWGPISKMGGTADYYFIRYGPNAKTRVDIFDINGDGLPDRVTQNAADTSWTVQLNNGTGFDPAIAWGPINKMGGTADYYFIRYGPNAKARVDIFDINGDGLPDRVSQMHADTSWTVQLNNGTGFDPAIAWGPINKMGGTADYYFIRYGPNGKTRVDIFDINGDGLPDRVSQMHADAIWTVQLNNGTGFEPPTDWGPINKMGGTTDYYFVRLIGLRVKVDIFDINGDGLPDRVSQNAVDATWTVQLNNGTGFDPAISWTGITSAGATNDNYFVRYVGTPRVKADIFDIDGDGLPDRVMQNGVDATWEIQKNTGYLPDLLVAASNGIGGRINIEYGPSTVYDNSGSDSLSDLPFPVPVVKSSTVSDGRGNSYTTTYDYADGVFDWQEREFRGFGCVKTTDPEGNYSESYFKQDDIFKGRLYRQEIKDSSGNLYAKTENTWQSAEVHPGVDFAYLSETNNFVYDGDATFKQTQTTFQYDEHGNPTQVFSEGEVGVSGDEKTLITEYTHNTNDWLIGFAKHAYLLDEASNKVSEKWFYYDGAVSIDDQPQRGLLTKEEVWLYNPITAGSSILDTRYSYDNYGNLVSTMDPLSRTITTEYDDVLHTYPVQTTNILGHTVSSTYDYKTGQVLTTTDPNGQTTEQAYDVLGRPIKVIGPLDSAEFPGVIYEYDLSISPIKITKHTRIQHLGSSIHTSYSFYDALSRQIQSKSPAEDDPQTGNPRQVISGTVTFDSRGKVKEKYFPYFVDESPDFSPPTYAQHKVFFDYDAVGRVIKTTNADGTFSTASYSDWVAIGADENGHFKTSNFDAYGRIIKVEEHNEGATYSTLYEYDAQGNLAKLTDDQSNITQIWYDSLGRKLKMDDPDMGVWEYEYNDVGSLIKQTDAKAQVLEFDYDGINRLTRKFSGVQTLVTYYYDEPTKENCVGRLSKVEDQSGQTEFFYDLLGREIKSEKVILGTGPYTVERTYDALDRLASLKYPDGEIVNYTYNKSGAIETVSGSSNYISNIDYSPTGQLTKVAYGNGAMTNYAYDLQTLRLTSLSTDSASGLIQNLSYEFDNVGNISSITDSINTATQSFVYDDLDRLVQGNGSYGTFTYEYDSIGNMTAKEGVGLSYGKNGRLPHAVTHYGATPIDYDANGNMVQKGTKVFSYDIENRLVAEADNDFLAQEQSFIIQLNPGWNFFSLPAIPASLTIADALSSIEGKYDQVTRYNSQSGGYENYIGDPAYDQFDSFEFQRGYQIYISDTQGATLEVTGIVPEQASQSLEIGWNLIGATYTDKPVSEILDGIEFTSLLRYNEAIGVLEEYPGSFSVLEADKAYYIQVAAEQAWTIDNTNGGATASFEYDGDGGRVVKRLEDGLGGVLSATTYVGSLYEVTDGQVKKHIFAGSNRIASVEADDTYYFHSDHLGSSNIVTDSSGNQAGHTEFTPYGSISTQSGSYDPEHKFTGKELDDSTGLYYYGARYYDPELGRFTQADTIVQAPTDPQTLNRFSYCRGNPLKYTDPTGHSFWDDLGEYISKEWKWFTNNLDQAAAIFFGSVLGAAVVSTYLPSFVNACAASGDKIHFWEGFLIGGVEVAPPVFAGTFAGNIASGQSFGDALGDAAIAGASAFVAAGLIEASYTEGWQSLVHFEDTQEVNIRQGFQKARRLRNGGNFQGASDIEMKLVRKYGWRKAVSIKHAMTIERYGKFVKNKPDLYSYQELKLPTKDPSFASGVAEYRGGIPNFTEGTFYKNVFEVNILSINFTSTTTDMPSSYTESFLKISFEGEWESLSGGESLIYGVLTE